jgi:hypothetical protein
MILYPLLFVLGVVVYVRYLERATVFQPTKVVLSTPKEVGVDYEDVYFPSLDNSRLHGWFIPAESRPEDAPVVIFLHGNAGNIGDRLEKILMFHNMGCGVFIVDYRRYGNSEGYPTEEGMYEDVQAAYDTLLARKDIRRDKVIVYGASLGGAAAVDLSTRREVDALILDSTFTSAADMGKNMFPFIPSFFLKVKLDSARKIQGCRMPKLFIHSTDDKTVPFALGQKLFERAPDPKAFLKITGDHNDGHVISERTYIGGITAFLRQYGLLKT